MPSSVVTTLEWAALLSAYQWCLRGLMILGTVGGIVSVSYAADGVPVWLVLIATVLIGYAVATPDSVAPALFFAVIALAWWRGVDDVTSPWALVAGLSLMTLHVATAHAAVAPPEATFAFVTRVRWLTGTAVVALATVALWQFAVVVDGARPGGVVALAAAALAGLLVVAWYLGQAGLGEAVDEPSAEWRE